MFGGCPLKLKGGEVSRGFVSSFGMCIAECRLARACTSECRLARAPGCGRRGQMSDFSHGLARHPANRSKRPRASVGRLGFLTTKGKRRAQLVVEVQAALQCLGTGCSAEEMSAVSSSMVDELIKARSRFQVALRVAKHRRVGGSASAASAPPGTLSPVLARTSSPVLVRERKTWTETVFGWAGLTEISVGGDAPDWEHHPHDQEGKRKIPRINVDIRPAKYMQICFMCREFDDFCICHKNAVWTTSDRIRLRSWSQIRCCIRAPNLDHRK